jgi:ribonucleoside-diphosphate reductase alpha chain
MELAVMKGKYPSFEGSSWSKGILPIDTARELPEEWERREKDSFEWACLREAVKKHGVRNSNCMAIAPTATIATIVGTTPCIEPVFKISYTEENKAGKFKVVDPSIKYHSDISKVKTAFDIDQKWVIKAAAVRQKWICQSQSVNIFKRQQMKGNELSELYFLAWELGLKATYYLKQQIASHDHEEIAAVEKSEEVVMCSIDNPDCESCQ